MDLNHIELPASMLADLYKTSLVETGELITQPERVNSNEESKAENIATWKYLGNNRKNILVVVNVSDAVHLPDRQLDFLTAMLTACRLSLDDVAVVNLNNHPEASYKELTVFFKSKITLLFAVEPVTFGLPMSFPHFQLQAFANNTFLFSPSLEELENDKLLKSKLWVCFKRLFNL